MQDIETERLLLHVNSLEEMERSMLNAEFIYAVDHMKWYGITVHE